MEDLDDDDPETERLLNFVLSGNIEQEYAGSAEELSAHWYDSAKHYPGDDALFPNGFHVITKHLAEGLRIETGQIVQEIHWQETPVRVVTKSQEFTADRVIVTLPLGVLKAGSVQFSCSAKVEDKRHQNVGHGRVEQVLSSIPRSLLAG